MSYADRKERVFRYGEPFDIPHSRSESRMKRYWSATDRRAWCDEVELRRKHILELNARSKGQFCLENFIPLDLLFNAMASNKDAEIEKLQQRIAYLEALLDVYKQIQLTPEQQQQVDDLNKKLAKERKKLKEAQQEERARSRDKISKEREPKRPSSEEGARVKPEKRKRSSSEPGASTSPRPPKRHLQDKPAPQRKRAREPTEGEISGVGQKPKKRKSGEAAEMGEGELDVSKGEAGKEDGRPSKTKGTQGKPVDATGRKEKPYDTEDKQTGVKPSGTPGTAPGKTAYKTPTKRDKDDATAAREDGRKRVKEDEADSKGEDKGRETRPKMRKEVEGGPGGLAKPGDARKPGEPAETRKPKTEKERPGAGGSVPVKSKSSTGVEKRDVPSKVQAEEGAKLSARKPSPAAQKAKPASEAGKTDKPLDDGAPKGADKRKGGDALLSRDKIEGDDNLASADRGRSPDGRRTEGDKPPKAGDVSAKTPASRDRSATPQKTTTKPSGAEMKGGKAPGAGETAARTPSPASKIAAREPTSDKSRRKEPSEGGAQTKPETLKETARDKTSTDATKPAGGEGKAPRVPSPASKLATREPTSEKSQGKERSEDIAAKAMAGAPKETARDKISPDATKPGTKMKEGRAPESGEKAPRAPSPASKPATREPTSEKPQGKEPSEDIAAKAMAGAPKETARDKISPDATKPGTKMKEGRAPESGEKAPRAPSPASKPATREPTSEKSQGKEPSEDIAAKARAGTPKETARDKISPDATKPSGTKMKDGSAPESGEEAPKSPSPASKLATREPTSEKLQGKKPSEDIAAKARAGTPKETARDKISPDATKPSGTKMKEGRAPSPASKPATREPTPEKSQGKEPFEDTTKPSGTTKAGRAPESREKATRAPSPASKLATREPTSEKSQGKEPSEDIAAKPRAGAPKETARDKISPDATKPSGTKMKESRAPESGEKAPKAPSLTPKMAVKEPMTDKTKGTEPSEDAAQPKPGAPKGAAGDKTGTEATTAAEKKPGDQATSAGRKPAEVVKREPAAKLGTESDSSKVRGRGRPAGDKLEKPGEEDRALAADKDTKKPADVTSERAVPSDQPARAKGRGRGRPDDSTEQPGGTYTSSTSEDKEDKILRADGEGKSKIPPPASKAAGEPRPGKSSGKEASEDAKGGTKATKGETFDRTGAAKTTEDSGKGLRKDVSAEKKTRPADESREGKSSVADKDLEPSSAASDKGKQAEPAARAKGRGRGKLDEARAPPGEPSQGKLIKDDGITKEDGLRKEDARRDKVSADRRGVPIDSTKPSAAEEQKGSKGKEKGDTTAQVPKPGVSDATRKDDGKVSLKETKGEPDIASRKQAETVGKDEKAFKPESPKDKKETGKPTGASSKEREAETAREKMKEASKAGVKPETGRKDDKEAKTKPDTSKDAELKPTKFGDKVMQEEKEKLEKPGIKKEAAREDGTTKPTKETVPLPKAEDQRTVSDIKKTRADLADSQKDKVPKEFKDTKRTEGDLKAREGEKMMGKPAKETAPTPGKILEKVEEDGKTKDAKKETKDLAKDGKEPITERIKKYEEKMAGREKTRPESEIQPAKRPESRGLADEKAKTKEEDLKKKEKDILKSAKRTDEDEILKDRGKPAAGKSGEVSPGVTDDKAKQAFKEKDQSIITKAVDKGDIAKDRPAGKIEEIHAAERVRELPGAADGKSKQTAKEKPLGDIVTTKAEDKDEEARKRVGREASPDTKQPDGDVKAKPGTLAKPVKGTEPLPAAKKAEDVMDVEPIKPLVTKPGKGIGEDVAGAEKAYKELTAGTAQADAIRRQKDEMAEERKKLEKVPKTGADLLKERKKEEVGKKGVVDADECGSICSDLDELEKLGKKPGVLKKKADETDKGIDARKIPGTKEEPGLKDVGIMPKQSERMKLEEKQLEGKPEDQIKGGPLPKEGLGKKMPESIQDAKGRVPSPAGVVDETKLDGTKKIVTSEAISKEAGVTTMKPEAKTGIPSQKAETTVGRKGEAPSPTAEDVRLAGARAEGKVPDEEAAQQAAAKALREKGAEEAIAAKMEMERAAKLKGPVTPEYEIKKEVPEGDKRLQKRPEYGEEGEGRSEREGGAAIPTGVSKVDEAGIKKESPYDEEKERRLKLGEERLAGIKTELPYGEEGERRLREEERLAGIKKGLPYGEAGEKKPKPEGDLMPAPGVFKRTPEEAGALVREDYPDTWSDTDKDKDQEKFKKEPITLKGSEEFVSAREELVPEGAAAGALREPMLGTPGPGETGFSFGEKPEGVQPEGLPDAERGISAFGGAVEAGARVVPERVATDALKEPKLTTAEPEEGPGIPYGERPEGVGREGFPTDTGRQIPLFEKPAEAEIGILPKGVAVDTFGGGQRGPKSPEGYQREGLPGEIPFREGESGIPEGVLPGLEDRRVPQFVPFGPLAEQAGITEGVPGSMQLRGITPQDQQVPYYGMPTAIAPEGFSAGQLIPEGAQDGRLPKFVGFGPPGIPGGIQPSGCKASCNKPAKPPSARPGDAYLQGRGPPGGIHPSVCRAACNTPPSGKPDDGVRRPQLPEDDIYLTPHLQPISLDTQEGLFQSARSKEEMLESKRIDHKCLAPCRNARERTTKFAEETGGVVIGTDSETPWDLAPPPGYYIPEDVSPRETIPDWAETSRPETPSLLDMEISTITESDKAIWAAPEPHWIPKLVLDWEEAPTDTSGVIPENIKTGSVVSRMLSGQVVGIPTTGPLLERRTPQTLTEAIYQTKCRAPCANKKVDREAVDEEPVETAEDISEINTDSELIDESPKIDQASMEYLVPDIAEEGIPSEVGTGEAAEIVVLMDANADIDTTTSEDRSSKLKEELVLDEVVESKADDAEMADVTFSTSEMHSSQLLVDDTAPAIGKLVSDEIVEPKSEDVEVTETAFPISETHETAPSIIDIDAKTSDSFKIKDDVVDESDKIDYSTIPDATLEEPSIDETAAEAPLEDISEVKSKHVSVTISDSHQIIQIYEGPYDHRDSFKEDVFSEFVPHETEVSPEQITQLEIQVADDDEDEFVDAQTGQATPDVEILDEVPKAEISKENKYAEAIKQLPVQDQSHSTQRFASWFAPRPPLQEVQQPALQYAERERAIIAECVASCSQASKTAGDVSSKTPGHVHFDSVVHHDGEPPCKPECRKTPSTTPCRHKCGSLPDSEESETPKHVCPTSTEPQYRETQKHSGSSMSCAPELESCLKKLMQPMKVCRATCAGDLTKEEKIAELEEEMQAKDAYCAEQRKIATAALAQLENIKHIVEERDGLRKKLETSQHELAQLRDNLDLGFGDSQDTEPEVSISRVASSHSCDNEIQVLEEEIQRMKATSQSPAEETRIIQKEVQVLKRYCAKLSSIQEENLRLKKNNQELELRCLKSEEKLHILGCDGDQDSLEQLKLKLLTLSETVAERDVLQHRVEVLEKELNAYHDLPEDVEVFKRRSVLLDDVLKDRDRLAKRVEQMRGLDEELLALKQKTERVDDLERQLRLATKEVQQAEDELDSMRNKCTMAEIDSLNQKTETETLKSRIVCMEHELESYKSMCKEQELLQIEKERLQSSLDELLQMQGDYEHMCVQMKALDVVKAERDRYKRKYEQLVGLETECNLLRTQLDKAKAVERERDILGKQTEDLEKCICEQEEEIKRLVSHIECLAQGKEQQQNKMKEVVSSLKIELEEKESILQLSEEKIATMNQKIDTSFHNLHDETAVLRNQNRTLLEENDALKCNKKCLENTVNHLKLNLQEKNEENTILNQQIEEQRRVIETMQEVLEDRELALPTTCPGGEIVRLQTDLEEAKLENERLQFLSNQPSSGDETNYQLKNMLEQSKCAVERIALELEEQYAEWDNKKAYRCCPGCNCKKTPAEPKVIIRCCAGCTCKKKTIKKPEQESKSVQCNCGCTCRITQPKTCICQKVPGTDAKLSTQIGDLNLKIPNDLLEEEDDQMYTARSGEPKLVEHDEDDVLVPDLSEHLEGESAALRMHSAEVQEVARNLDERLKKAQARIRELEEENSYLKSQLGQQPISHVGRVVGPPDHFRDNKDSPQDSQETQEELANCLKEKDALLNLVNNLKSQLASMQKGDEPDLTLFAQLKTDLAECLKDKESLTAEIQALKLKLSASSDADTLAKLKADLEVCLKERQSLLKIINELKGQGSENLDLTAFKKLQADLENCMKEREMLLKQLNDLQKHLDPSIKADLMSTPDNKLQVELQECKDTIAKLRAELQKCLNEKDALAKALDDLRSQKPASEADDTLKLKTPLPEPVKLQNDLDKALKDKENLLKMLEEQKMSGQTQPDAQELIKLKTELDNCLKEKGELLKMIDNLKKELSKAGPLEVTTGPDAELAKLKAELSTCLKEKEDLLKLIEGLKAQLQSKGDQKDLPDLQKRLDDALQQKEDLKAHDAELAKLKAELSTCLKEKEDLLKLIEGLKAQLQSKGDQKDLPDLQKRLDDALQQKEDLKSYDAELAKLKAELSTCLKEKEDLLKLIEGLKAQLQSKGDQKDLSDLQKRLDDALKQKEDLKAQNANLVKEKDDLDKMLMSNVATTTKRSSKMEADLEGLANQNKKLQADNDRLSKLEQDYQNLKNENDRLKAEIEKLKLDNTRLNIENDNLKKTKIDPATLEALKKESEGYKKQMEALIGKDKPAPIDMKVLEKDGRDKAAMQSTIDDLENQLKSLMTKDKLKAPEPSGEFNNQMNELMKQLNDAQKRAETAEEAARKMKTSDPTAMLTTQIDQLKARIAQLEAENDRLKNALTQANADKDNLKKDLDNTSKENQKLKNDNQILQQKATEPQEKAPTRDDTTKVQQMENNLDAMKKEADKSKADAKAAITKMNDLQDENADLKKKLTQLEAENTKLKKDLATAQTDLLNANNKVLDLEKDNAKCKKNVSDLEAEVARLKKELDGVLNDAKKGTNTVGDLQAEIAALKQKLNQTEAANSKLNSDKDKMEKDLEQAKANIQATTGQQDASNKLKQENAALQDEINKLKKAQADSSKPVGDLQDLKTRLLQLEAENDKLKKSPADKKLDNLQEDYDKLRKRIAELENENSKLKKDFQKALDDARKASDDLAEMKQNEAKLKGKIAQLEGDNDKLNKNLNSTLDQMKKMGSEMADIQGGESKSKQKAALLESELSKLRKDLENAMGDAKKSGGEVQSLRDENSKLKQRLAQLEMENAKLKTEVDSGFKALNTATSDLKKLQEENNKCKDRIKQLEADLGKVKQKPDEPKGDDDSVKVLQDQLSKLKKDLDAAKQEALNCSQENAKLKDENSRLQSKIKQLESENSKLKSDLAASTSQVGQLKADQDKLKSQLNQTEEANKKLQKEKAALADDASKAGTDLAKLGELKDNENKLKQRIAQLEIDNAKLKKDLDAALTDRKKLSDDMAAALNETNKLKQQLTKSEDDSKKTKNELENVKKQAGDLADLKQVNEKLKQRIAQLEADNAKLKADMEKALDNAKKTLGDLSKLQDEDNKLRQKLAQQEIDNSKLKKDLEKTPKEVKTETPDDSANKLKQQLAQLESDKAGLKKQLDAALSDAKAKTQEISKLQDEINNLKLKIAQLQKENEQLKKNLAKETENASKQREESGNQTQKVNDLQAQIEKLKKNLQDAKPTTKPLSDDMKQLQQLEADNSKLKKDLENALKDASQSASLKQENANLKSQIAKMQDTLDKLKKDLEAALNEAKKSAAELSKVKDNEAQLKQKVAQLETQTVNLKKDIDETKVVPKDSDSLKAENNKLREQIKQLQAEIEKLKGVKAPETKVVKPEIGIGNLKDEIANLKQKMANLQMENAKLKEEYDHSLSALHDAESSSSDSKKETDKLKNRINQLEQEVANLKKQLASTKPEVKTDKDTTLTKTTDKPTGDYQALLQELAKQKKECEDTIASLKAQFDRDIKNLLKKNDENIDKLQKAHGDYVQSLNAKHDKEIQALKDIIDDLTRELEGNKRDKDKLKNLVEDQKRKSLEIKSKVADVEKVVMRERKRSKELERKHSDLKTVASVLEQEVLKERKRSQMLEKENEEVIKQLRASLTKSEGIESLPKMREDRSVLGEEKKKVKEEPKAVKTDSVVRPEAQQIGKKVDTKVHSGGLEETMEGPLKTVPEEVLETAESQAPKIRKKRDDKLTMATFETVSLPPAYLTLTTPLSADELAFYGKKLCPCANSLDELLKKAALKGFAALTVEELQFVHKQLNEAAANILERLGQQAGLLRPSQGRDRLSLLRRIAELEGDLLKKQRQTQQKISEMQNAIKLEKDRLTQLRENLEREKERPDTPRTRISRDVDALEKMKSELEKRLDEKLLNKMRLTRLTQSGAPLNESPVRDTNVATRRRSLPTTYHSTGKL